MSTTVNFDLSSTLLSELTAGGSGNGVYAYAVAFSGSTLTTYATLVNSGVVDTTSISLPNGSGGSATFSSGTIYVLIEQAGAGNPSAITPSSLVLGDITPANAQASNYSYQLFEATLANTTFDQGDISALNTFGFTSQFQVVFADNTTQSVGFRASGASIFSTLSGLNSQNVQNYNPNSFANPAQLAIGPATAGNQGFPSTDWQAYVDALKTNQTVLNDIQIVTTFNGGAAVQGVASPAMLSEYGVQYVAQDSYGSDYFWLVPNTQNGATNTDWIRIPASQLMANIYAQTGTLEVHQGGKDGPVVVYSSFTPNNADGTVARDFVAGFDAGYWGGSGSSPNPLVTQAIDLNHNSNWNINYAYNATLNPGVVSYSNVLGTGAGTQGGNDRFYDPWAQTFLANSNAYGYSYSDLVSAGGVNPQITLWDPTLGTNVATINISLFDATETPPAGGFQTSPTGYVAPTSGSYSPNLTLSTNQIGFSFNFSVGGSGGYSLTNFAPNANTPVYFKFYAPGSAQAGEDGFVSLQVTSASNGDWYYYNLSQSGSTWSLTATNPSGLNGFFNISNVPVTADGSTSWYQLVFGDQGDQTIYNFYASSDATTHAFTNMVVDHGAQVTYGTGANPLTAPSINFAPGGAVTYDVTTLSPPTPGGDVGGDGYGDLVFQSANTSQLQAWTMNGLSVVSTGAIGTAPGLSWRLGAVADVNHDGRADTIFQNSLSGQIAAWALNGLTLIDSGVVASNPTTGLKLKSTGDLNGDGNADILFQDIASGAVTSWQMSGLTVASSGVIATPGINWQVEATGDVNGDGRSDIILQDTSTGAVAIWEMNGLSIIRAAVVATPGAVWQVKGSGHFNADGYADLVLQNSATGDVAMWEMNGLTIQSSGVLPYHPGTDWQVRQVTDLNADGYTDIVLQNVTTSAVAGWEMNGLTATSTGLISPASGFDWQLFGGAPPTHGDFNGDGHGDLVFQSSASGDLLAWEMNGADIATFSVLAASPGLTWQMGAVGDVNHDGRADLAFQDSGTGQLAVWEMGALQVLDSGVLPTSLSAGSLLKTAGDLNGDGNADLILQTATSGAVTVVEMNGLSVLASGVVATPGAAWQAQTSADVNGDGKADIILQNSTTGDVAIWEMNGLTIASAGVVPASPGVAWQIKGAGDVNADGYADLVFQNSSTGQVAVWEMNGTSILAAAVLPGNPTTAWQVHQISDLTGDGFADIVFQNASTSAVAEWQMNGLSVTSAAVISQTPGMEWHLFA